MKLPQTEFSFSFWRWLAPGLRVKRYLLVALAGLFLLLLGVVQLSWEGPLVTGFFRLARWAGDWVLRLGLPLWVSGILLLLLGSVLIALGIRWMNRSVISALTDLRDIPERVYQQRRLERGPSIVALGGGTGLSRVLRGLRQETANITAIVAVTDDGGSTGRLRSSFGVPAVGDLVDCLSALSEARDLPELLRYRFERGGELAGHTFGNLMLVSLNELEGSFAEALRQANQILRLRGAVWPATPQPVRLWALREDGVKVEGETAIRERRGRILRVGIEPERVASMPEALEAIRHASLIVLGPGSLYTSVIPSFLPPEIQTALRTSAGKICYIANVMTEVGETDGLSAGDHFRAIQEHLGRVPDLVLAHTAAIEAGLLERYRQEGQVPVELDLEGLEASGVQVIRGDFLEQGSLAQHDPEKLVRALLSLG